MGELNTDWSSVLDTYLGSARPGALIVSGEWGSGKTHLYKNHLMGMIKSKGYSEIYVSLYAYGLQGKQLEDFVIEQYSGIDGIDDDSKQSASSILKTVMSEFTGKSTGSSVWGAVAQAAGGVVKKRIMTHLSSHVLCLDDVDRIDGALFEKAWAEINYYAEYKRQKIIILIDESRLPNKSVRDPKLEKNVWGVYSIYITAAGALEHAFGLLSRDRSETIREAHDTGLFLHVVTELDIKNIRSIHAALEATSRLALSVQLIDVEVDPDVVHELYQLIFLVNIISSMGLVEVNKVIEHVVLRSYSLKVRSAISVADVKLTPEELFVARLPDFQCLSKPRFMFLYEYWLKNFLDTDALSNAICVRHVLNFDDDPLYRFYAAIPGRMDLTSNDYLDYIDEVKMALAVREPKNYSLLSMYGLLNMLSVDGSRGAFPGKFIDLDIELAECVRSFEADLVSEKLNCFSMDRNQGYRTEDGLEVLVKTKEAFDALKKTSDNVDFRNRASEKFMSWTDDPDLDALRELSEDRSHPVMNILTKKGVEHLFSVGTNRQLEIFLQIINNRYSIGGHVPGNKQEFEFLSFVRDVLAREIGYGYRRTIYLRGRVVLDRAMSEGEWTEPLPLLAFK